MRPRCDATSRSRDLISIHAPTWGATALFLVSSCFILFQSTHPRGVRPSHRFDYPVKSRISIHAPTWGATDPKRGVCVLGYISIHAPTWGATWKGSRAASTSYFNPRTHVGCDKAEDIRGLVGYISIHAPTWGATPNAKPSVNPTGFQSTHPRGVRLYR